MSLTAPQTRTVTDPEVKAAHAAALIIDTHNDISLYTITGLDIGKRSPGTTTDLPRLKEGGVGAVFFSAYVAPAYAKENRSATRAFQLIDSIRHDIVEGHPRDFVLALSAEDIENARRQGRIAALIGLEGGHAIEDNLRLLRTFYSLGVRSMTLTYSNSNDWADSSGDQDDVSIRHHNGLTGFGREVVLEMNRLGMMVDVSHVSDKTFWDVLAVSRSPIFASHSSCRAVTNHPRNMTDEMIRALAKHGGVIQINFLGAFVSRQPENTMPKTLIDFYERWDKAEEENKDNPKALASARKAFCEEAQRIGIRATIDDLVAHIDHVVKVGGVDAVGIGTDFDGLDCAPMAIRDVSELPKLTRALMNNGYSTSDIRKIYGGNTLRVLRSVERIAQESH